MTAASLVVFYIRSSYEPEEDEGVTKEPEVSSREQAKFDWAQTWMEEGGSLDLAESKAQRLLSRYLGLPDSIPTHEQGLHADAYLSTFRDIYWMSNVWKGFPKHSIP